MYNYSIQVGRSFALMNIFNTLQIIYCRIQNSSTTPLDANVPQAYMELDPQTLQYEHPYQQPTPGNPITSKTYMDLDPQTREDKSLYQDLDNNPKSLHGSEAQAYENVQGRKPNEARRN